jgi:hypothetical protein
VGKLQSKEKTIVFIFSLKKKKGTTTNVYNILKFYTNVTMAFLQCLHYLQVFLNEQRNRKFVNLLELVKSLNLLKRGPAVLWSLLQ